MVVYLKWLQNKAKLANAGYNEREMMIASRSRDLSEKLSRGTLQRLNANGEKLEAGPLCGEVARLSRACRWSDMWLKMPWG